MALFIFIEEACGPLFFVLLDKPVFI